MLQHALDEQQQALARTEQARAEAARQASLLEQQVAEQAQALRDGQGRLADRERALAEARWQVTEAHRLLEATRTALHQSEQINEEKSQALGRLEQAVSERDHALVTMREALANATRTLAEREQRLHDLEHERTRIREELEGVYGSTVFRWIVRPLWATLVVLRRPVTALRRWDRRRILVVKPFYVPAADALRAITRLRHVFPQARIAVLANVFPEDYRLLEQETAATTRWFYGPPRRPLRWWRLLGLIGRASLQGFAEGILLVNPDTPGVYAKGTLLLAAVCPQVAYYDIRTGRLSPDHPARRQRASDARRSSVLAQSGQAIQSLLHTGLVRLIFGLLALGFIVLVWVPLRWRRLWQRR
jgi:hypothetical protein